MDDFGFKYPKKLMAILGIVAILIGVGWGLITRDKEKGTDAYMGAIRVLFQPLFNRLTNPLERAVERLKTATTTESSS